MTSLPPPTAGMKMNRDRDTIAASSLDRAAAQLLCNEAEDILGKRQYARSCHAMVDAIDMAGELNADLRREIALRMWSMLYGTLWTAGV